MLEHDRTREQRREVDARQPDVVAGPAQQVALAGRDLELAQHPQLLGRLDALGDRDRALAPGEVQERAQDRARGVALRAFLHEREVDLHDVEADLREEAQAGVAGADVVGRDADAGVLEQRDVAAQPVEVGDVLALGQLDDDAARD